MATDDTVTLTIEADDERDELTIPTGLIGHLAEGDASAPRVVGDIALSGLAGRVHAAVHHAEGEVDPELASVEEATMEQFEDRFGMTYGEATGHSH
jgi:hypothetical protein